MPTVVIDPGHGGATADGGSSPNNATGPNGLLEKDVTLDLGRRVSALLANRANVILTRTTDVNVSLSDRAKVARDANADLFLSIHLNGWKDPAVDGTETWVAKNASAASRDLAERVLTHVVGVTHAPNRGVKEEDFGVIRSDRQAPRTAATLVEVAFLTNPGEAERFTDDDYKQAVAQAIADAIVERLPAPPTPTAQSLSGGGGPAATGTIFLAPNITNTYTDYIQPVTRGDLQPLINGNSSNPASAKTEPLDEMQSLVQTLGAGDSVYLAAWYFDPTTPLTLGASAAAKTWGGFLTLKAVEGVKVRILATDFDDIEPSSHANVRAWMGLMDRYLALMPATARDNLQYVVSMQPVTMGPLHGTIFVGRLSVHIGSHHQKFMVVKKGEETYAFCGGLDIESRKTPAAWGYAPGQLIGWHDIHVKMRGPVARDFEKEFALRWNRESGSSTVVPSPNPWSGLATLPVPSPAVDGEVDSEADRKQEDVQMERTVSSDATIGFTTNQDNVKQIYKNIVNASQSFLYFENQYFRSSDLADWIVARANAVPSMPVLFVVVFSAGYDDGDDEITHHGECLQFQFFDKIVKALGSRTAIYTMTGRSVHSKFLLADDRYMTIGSANANERGFQLDSELNIAVDDSKLAGSFRKRLWAHNLGATEATVAGWSVSDFITQWDAVATANSSLAPSAMAGEGVVRWDYTQSPGNCHFYIPDYLADNNADRGDEPNKGGLLAVNDVPPTDDLGNVSGGGDGGTAIA